MRDLFSEYYRPTDEEFSRLWQDAIFVFDTNVLLRYLPDNEMVGIGGFCISPRNGVLVSGGYAKTPYMVLLFLAPLKWTTAHCKSNDCSCHGWLQNMLASKYDDDASWKRDERCHEKVLNHLSKGRDTSMTISTARTHRGKTRAVRAMYSSRALPQIAPTT